MSVEARHDVHVSGVRGSRPMVFAHGFGCDQRMWRHVAPRFEQSHEVVLFDYVGYGGADPSAYDPQRYSTLHGYADDVVELLTGMGLRDVVFVGHSVSCMIGVLAAARRPDLFSALVMVGPSPRYLDDGEYVGGFTCEDVDELLAALGSNYLGWSEVMAPAIMGHPERPELGQELTDSFCRADPEVARRFAEATFRSDNRADLPRVSTPTLVLQCSQDVIAPVSVGEYVRDAMPDARMVLLDATGHCPHLSAPDQTAAAIEDFVRRLPRRAA